MSQNSFVIMAFGVTAFGMIWLVVASFLAMRRSEALATETRPER